MAWVSNPARCQEPWFRSLPPVVMSTQPPRQARGGGSVPLLPGRSLPQHPGPLLSLRHNRGGVAVCERLLPASAWLAGRGPSATSPWTPAAYC